MLMTPGISSAQRRGGGGGWSGGGAWRGGGWGGYRGGYGGYRGYGGYGGYWGGFWPGFGLGYASGYRGYGYGYNYPSEYGAYYYEPSYASVEPSATPSYYYSPPDTAADVNPNVASIEVRVPVNAEIWFEGEKTSQTGAVRHFQSPELQPGKTFTYDVRARWTDAAGKEVDRTKQVKVQAGARVGVDFSNP
jgi:uncharacterized protein (TIGR03000 family)